MTEKERFELSQIHTDACDLGTYAITMLRDSIDAFDR